MLYDALLVSLTVYFLSYPELSFSAIHLFSCVPRHRNCYSTHLLRYLYAKLCSAVERRVLRLRPTSPAATPDPGNVEQMSKDRSREMMITNDTKQTAEAAPSTTTETPALSTVGDSSATTTIVSSEDSAEEVERATERDWHSVLLSLGMHPLTAAEPDIEGTIVPTISDYEALRSRAIEINIGDGEAARYIDSNAPYTATSGPIAHERHIVTWRQQVAHLSYHSCMSLLAVSRRERREWAECEAEAVRLFFQLKGVRGG